MDERNYWTRRFGQRASRRRFIVGGSLLAGATFAAACSSSSSPGSTPGTNSAPSGQNAGGAASATRPAGAATSAGSTPASAVAQSASSPQASAKQPKRGGTLRWGLEANLDTVDPIFTTATVTAEIALQLYDQLFAYDAAVKPQPSLVKDYTVSPDKLTYSFNLREDATFEGGRPVLSGDVVPSVERWGKQVSSGISLMKNVNSLQAQGDHAFVIELKAPYFLLLDTLAGGSAAPYVMTKEAASTPPTQPVNDVVASGPFRLDQWVKGSKIVLKPRSDYKGPAGPPSNAAGSKTAYVDAIEVTIIPDQNSRLSAFQAGTIDVMTQPSSDYYEQLKGSKDTQVIPWNWGFYNVLLTNHARPPFDNVLARQSVLAAIDVDKFMTAGWGKVLWTKGPGIFLSGTPNDSMVSADQFDQKNLAKAKQLFTQLQQSGGYDGRPIVVLANTTYQYMYNIGLVAKQTLEAIGFKVDLQTPDWASAVDLRPAKDKWDFFITATNPFGQNDPLRSPVLNPAYPGWYSSGQMQDLQNQYAASGTPDQAHAIIDKVQALWYQDVPAVLLGQSQNFDALKSYVQGYSNSPVYSTFWNVWLDR